MSRAKSPSAREAGFRHQNLPLRLLHAREAVIGQFRPLLNAQGVTEQQWRIIRALLEYGPMEPREIGPVCRFSSPAVAGMLRRMEELSLVTKVRHDDDRRRVTIGLTARSHEIAAALAPQIEQVYDRIEEHIGPEFIEIFQGALDKLIASMGELPPVDEA